MTPQQQQETLTFHPTHAALLTPYLPPSPEKKEKEYPHLTLTYAHSLDASLALAPGVRTALSGAQSKAMTHFLRARHEAILVGAGTAVADDPGLNSRLDAACFSLGGDGGVGEGTGGVGGGVEGVVKGMGVVRQPRPVVLDPKGRWAVGEGSRVIRTAGEGKGLGPWVMVVKETEVDEGRRRVLEKVGGRYIALEARGEKGRFEWADVLAALKTEGIKSVMVEGGGEVINSLLVPAGNAFVDSVIVTIAPTWLGQGGVVVSPPRTTDESGLPAPPVRLTDVAWCPLGEDVVLCGRIQR